MSLRECGCGRINIHCHRWLRESLSLGTLGSGVIQRQTSREPSYGTKDEQMRAYVGGIISAVETMRRHNISTERVISRKYQGILENTGAVKMVMVQEYK